MIKCFSISRKRLPLFKDFEIFYKNKENVVGANTITDYYFSMDITTEEELFLKLSYDAKIFNIDEVSLKYFHPIENYVE